MVRTVLCAALLIAFAVPGMAQDDFPRVQTSLGYANLGFPDVNGDVKRHSGFAMHNGFNLTRWFGMENYTGAYGLGNDTTLYSNIVGGKFMLRTDRVVPYAVAGIGVGYFTQQVQGGYIGGGATNTRLGGGVDLPFNDGMSFRLDASKFSFRSGGWLSGWNFSTTIVFNLM